MDGNKTLKVCHLASGDLWAGAEVQIFTLLNNLARRDDLSISAILLNDGRLAEALRIRGISVTVIDESRHHFLSILKQLREVIDHEPPDMLHTHRYKENILGALVRKKCNRVTLVQTVHGVQETFQGLERIKAGFYMALNNFYSARYFDGFVAVSADIKRYLASKMPPDKITVIHNGVDLDELQLRKSAGELREALNLPADSIIMGTAGRLVGIKGFDILLNAAKQILARIPGLYVVIAGEGPDRTSLEKQAAALGIAERVRLLGFRDDVLDILNMLDLFVMSSRHEGIPTVLLEAMALGKASVVTAVGGMVEVVEDGTSGRLVSSENADQLASACVELLSDDSLARQLGRAAKSRVHQEFSSVIQAQRTIAVYEQLTGRA